MPRSIYLCQTPNLPHSFRQDPSLYLCFYRNCSLIMPINRKDYHPDWRIISLFVRYIVANNRCQKCKAYNYFPHPFTGSKVILTTAHLDHDRTNNAWENLSALCQRCHLRHDREQHIASARAHKPPKPKLIYADFDMFLQLDFRQPFLPQIQPLLK